MFSQRKSCERKDILINVLTEKKVLIEKGTISGFFKRQEKPMNNDSIISESGSSCISARLENECETVESLSSVQIDKDVNE